MGILLSLLAATTLALSQVTLKRSFNDLLPSNAFFFDVVFGLIIWVPFAILNGVNYTQLSKVFLFALLSAVLSEAYFFFILAKGKLSITGTLLASYPIYTILFSIVINKERLHYSQWIFIAITIIGTLIITFPERFEKKELVQIINILWAVSGAVAVGLADALAKNIIDQSSSETFLFALAFTQIPIAYIYLRIENQKIPFYQFQDLERFKFAIVGSVLNVLGVMLLFLAFQQTFASIASTLTGTYPVLIVVFARFFLGESISKLNTFGLAIVIIGIIGLSYIL